MSITTKREWRAQNPSNRTQKTDRFNATWGEARTADSVYESFYKLDLEHEPVQPFIDYPTQTPAEALKRTARGWAKKKYPELDQDDVSQVIELKAWELEDHELNEEGEWIRPPYVMTALKNAVHDHARQEIGFEKAHKLSDEVIVNTKFDAIDEEMQFTNKTLKAGLMLFVAAPYTLSVLTRDSVYRVYKCLSRAEHAALFQMVVEPNPTANKTLDKVVAKYLVKANA